MTRPTDPAAIERDEKALRLQESGLTLAVIAERMGVTKQAVYLMIARAKDRREAEDASLS